MGAAFETPEPAAPPPTAQPAPVPQLSHEVPEAAPSSEWFTAAPEDDEPGISPQLSPEVPKAAPPSEWFTEHEPPAPNEVRTTEAPATETPATEAPAAEVPLPTPPPVAPPVQAPPVQAPPVQAQSEAQILDEEIAAATPASALPGSAAAAMAEELTRGMGGLGVSAGSGEALDTTPVEVIQPSPTEAPAPEAQGRIIEMPASPQPNAAEQLRHDMEPASPPTPMPEPVPQPIIPDPFDFSKPATPVIDMPEPRQQPTAAELLRQEMQAAIPPPSPEIVERPVIQAPEPVVPPPMAVPPPAAQAPPQAEPSAASPAPAAAQPPPAPVGPPSGHLHRTYLSDVPVIAQPGPFGIRLGSVGPSGGQREHYRHPADIQRGRDSVHIGPGKPRTEHRGAEKQIPRCTSVGFRRGPLTYRLARLIARERLSYRHLA